MAFEPFLASLWTHRATLATDATEPNSVAPHSES